MPPSSRRLLAAVALCGALSVAAIDVSAAARGAKHSKLWLFDVRELVSNASRVQLGASPVAHAAQIRGFTKAWASCSPAPLEYRVLDLFKDASPRTTTWGILTRGNSHDMARMAPLRRGDLVNLPASKLRIAPRGVDRVRDHVNLFARADIAEGVRCNAVPIAQSYLDFLVASILASLPEHEGEEVAAKFLTSITDWDHYALVNDRESPRTELSLVDVRRHTSGTQQPELDERLERRIDTIMKRVELPTGASLLDLRVAERNQRYWRCQQGDCPEGVAAVV